jgi:hypothetical protein
MKFDRTLVVRNTLTDLEAGIDHLRSQGFEIDETVPDTYGITVIAALREIRNKRVTVTIPMRRPIQEG